MEDMVTPHAAEIPAQTADDTSVSAMLDQVLRTTMHDRIAREVQTALDDAIRRQLEGAVLRVAGDILGMTWLYDETVNRHRHIIPWFPEYDNMMMHPRARDLKFDVKNVRFKSIQDPTCYICMDNRVHNNQWWQINACGHTSHRACLKEWWATPYQGCVASCPYCKAPVEASDVLT